MKFTGYMLLIVGIGIAALVAYAVFGKGLHANSPIANLQNRLAGRTSTTSASAPEPAPAAGTPTSLPK